MENNVATNESIDATEVPKPPPRKWKTILRQNSERIGAFAEDAVLPKNQRSSHNIPQPVDVESDDGRVQDPYRLVFRRQPVKMQPKYFPFFVIGISLIQIAVMYLLDNETMILMFAYDPHRRHEIWRYLTDAFVHKGRSHLWSNMLLQAILGVLLEIVHNYKRISVVYLTSVLGGSLFMTVLSPRTYVVGASGGVYGLLGSHLSTIILNWNQMDWKRCRLFWLLFYILGNFLLQAVVVELNDSLAGHLGGAISGFLISILVLKNFEKHPWEKKMQTVCLGALIALLIAIVVVNIVQPSLYLPTEWHFDYVHTYEEYLVDLVVTSANSSTVRKECRIDARCMILMMQRNITV